jgi:hypothetical protein
MKGSVTYISRCEGLILEPIEIPVRYRGLSTLRLETQKDRNIKATFNTDGIYDENQAKEITLPIINRIIDRLVYILKTRALPPVYSGSSLPLKQDINTRDVTYSNSTTVCLDAILEIVIKPKAEEIETVKTFLSMPPCDSELLYSEYAFALRQTNRLSTFMLLYNILLQVAGDSQKSVDNMLKAVKPDIEIVNTRIVINGKNKAIEETVYTKLRNEVAHKRVNIEKEATVNEIKLHINEFKDLVKVIIRNITES